MAVIDLTYYNITINTSALGGVTPADGAIDNTTPEQYGASSGLPATDALSLTKERGNMRYEHLLELLATDISPVVVTNLVATAADEDTEATAFALTVGYDRPDFVTTEDEANPGTWLTTTAAVQRYVARALITDLAGNRDVYNAEAHGGLNPQGSMVESVSATKIAANIVAAEAQITVIASNLAT